ncbi:GGDEF domain-containing protein [Spirochaetota bacterium]
MNSIAKTIKDSPLFTGMNSLELNMVSAFLETRKYKKGEYIFKRGELGTEMFIVKSGRISSMVLDKDGNERELYEFASGRFFGEMSIIENESRSASCIAREDSEVFVLDEIDFYRLVQEQPLLGSKMLSSMARVMSGWLDEASGFLHDLVRWGESARKRAVSDELTGLFNRRFLEEVSRSRFLRAGADAPICSVLMLDLDYFHNINENYGSQAGDSVIKLAGTKYSLLVREGDVASRLAGDEFAFFMPEAGPKDAAILAERIRRATEELSMELVDKKGQTNRLKLSASIGLASSPADATDQAGLFAAADKALFKAKEQGRNRVFAFSQ